MTLEAYNFKNIEQKCIQSWYTSSVYKWDSTETRENTFVVDTPPPTVSGSLHIGHVFSYTHTDIIVRFQRMLGKNIFYPIGFDDNGLPTERLVEKKKNVSATNMPRHEFVVLCKEVVKEEEEKFRQLFKSIGLSFDWDLEYQTISEHTKKISQLSFLDLIEKNQLYRADQPMLWDPVDQTALAQAEIEDKEFQSHMNDIIFHAENGSKLIIATTRPELLPACVAVFYHPDDKRYQNLSGKYAISPLFKVRIPILADDKVDPEKGTGLVMCCTFGDATDILWWKKHHLPLRVVLSKNGRILKSKFENSIDLESAEKFSAELENLKISEARAKIIEILQAEGLLVKQTPVTQMVKCAERSGSPLEILSTPQWFIKAMEHKEVMLELSAQLNWHPKHMKVRLDSWINSLAWDWCISRQRFFGVPIPVWYSKRAGEEGKVLFPSSNDLPVDPLIDLPAGYTKDEVEPDKDIMDTWATSAVSPQINSHAINDKFAVDLERHNKLFPADLRPQAHEIIRVWAFGTILKAHLHQKKLPWHNIMISGWCLAHDKSKMSKSKGNVITPEGLLEKYGADVIRYWASTARLGSDTAYSEDIMNNGKRFINKLWNASKFVSTNFGVIDENPPALSALIENGTIFCAMDLWIIDKLQKAIHDTTQALKSFEYSVAREVIDEFFWKDFCDNYLEIVKTRSYNSNSIDIIAQKSAVYTLYWCLNILLKLFAPFVPFATEEIYANLFGGLASIHSRGAWPQLLISIDKETCAQGSIAIEILDLVRKYKAEKQISIKTPINELQITLGVELSSELIADLKNVTNAEKITLNKQSGSALSINII